MALEYVVGPIIALLLGMKFTDYTSKKAIEAAASRQTELISLVEAKIVESNTQISQQTLKLLMPVAKSMTKVNEQLGL